MQHLVENKHQLCRVTGVMVGADRRRDLGQAYPTQTRMSACSVAAHVYTLSTSVLRT